MVTREKAEKIAAGVVIAVALVAGLGPAIASSMPEPMDFQLADPGDLDAPAELDEHAGHDHGDGAHGEEPRPVQQPASGLGANRAPSPGQPPAYLRGKAYTPTASGPARALYDGAWCGNGEPMYRVFDIHSGADHTFRIRLSAEGSMPFVQLEGANGSFAAYDPRRHSSSSYSITGQDTEPTLEPPFTCPRCGHDRFHVAVGFEIPSDSTAPDDTSWVALSARCNQCQWESIVFGGETS